MKFLNNVKSKLADAAAAAAVAAPRSRSLVTSNVPDGADVAPQKEEDPVSSSSTTTVSPTDDLPLGTFDFPSSYPDLYSEANDMVNLSNLIYVLVEVRALARRGNILSESSTKQILDLPLSLAGAAAIVTREAELLKEKLDDGKNAATLSALASLLGRQNRQNEEAGITTSMTVPREVKKPVTNENGMMGWVTNCFVGSATATIDATTTTTADETLLLLSILVIDNLKCNEELVYAIGINPNEQRNTVIFCGSVTPQTLLPIHALDLFRQNIHVCTIMASIMSMVAIMSLWGYIRDFMSI